MTDAGVSVCVVLPASGTGERFGTDPPKQFSRLFGNPLLLHTVNLFHRLSWVKHIILPVSRNHMAYVQGLVDENNYNKVTVIEGASSRHRTIYLGVLEIQRVCLKPDVVIIQDVVRMFADEETIRNVAVAAKTYGAAGVTRPLVSTVISSDGDGFLQESLDRSRYCASEMPQGFVFSVILTAYQKSTEEDFDHGTECLLLALKYTGTRAKLIEGPDNLWKVTYRKDLYAAEGMLKESQVRVVIKTMKKTLRCLIKTACKKKRLKVLEENEECEEEFPNSFITSCLPSDLDQKIPNFIQGVFKHYAPNKISMITPVVILVAVASNFKTEDETRLREMCCDIRKKDGNMSIIYGILLENEEDCQEEVADMIASLLWNRDVTLSGQVFNIRS